MALKVIIQPSYPNFSGNYPTFLVDNGDDVRVGPCGELVLVGERDAVQRPTKMRVYAPGTWEVFSVTED